jgi:replicative DNA helicase
VSTHNLDAERSVLGGMLVNAEQIETARGVLRAEDFFRVAHQRIFAAILVLHQRKLVADMVTVCDYLGQAGTLDDTGGAVYIAGLTDGVPSSVNVPYYARLVKAHAVKRELLKAAQAIIEATKTEIDAQEAIDLAESAIGSLAMQQPTDLQAGPVLAKEASALLEDIAARKNEKRLTGLSSGLPELDAMTDGFQPGDLVVVAARPSQGKTALALQLALACEAPAAFFSLEMRRAQLSIRALAWLARVDGWKLRTGRLDTAFEYERVSRAMTDLAESGLAIDDASDLTVWQIRSKARRWRAEHGLALVVVDYLQLVTPTRDKQKQQNREQEVARMSRAFKGLAKDLHVPVLLLAQLNRSAESRGEQPPKLSDLRESGAIEQDADVVIMLHRPNGASVKDEGEAHLIVAKHRNGPTGTVQTWWVPSMTAFRNFPR